MSTSIDDSRMADAEALRNGMHVLTATLLVVTIFASMRLPLGAAVVNLLLLATFAMVYFAGSSFVESWPPPARWLWLIALTGIWLADVLIAPLALYLVFALYFVYLWVLDDMWGVVMVIITTALAVATQVPQGLSVGGVMGPVVSASVTIAISYAFRSLQRVTVERENLIEELMRTRTQLAETEHAAGMTAERQRIAHEIHDTLAQGLSSIQMLLHAAERDLDSPAGAPLAPAAVAKAQQRIDLARQTAAHNLQEARAMIAALQPAGLKETSLSAAMSRMAAGFAAAGDMTIEVETDGEAHQLPMKVEAAALRIAQGAVGNVVKHAQATRARITITYSHDELRVDVVDNGRGFDLDAVRSTPAGLGHIGLSAMSRRAEELGGSVTVESTPGGGTALTAALPLSPPAALGPEL